MIKDLFVPSACPQMYPFTYQFTLMLYTSSYLPENQSVYFNAFLLEYQNYLSIGTGLRFGWTYLPVYFDAVPENKSVILLEYFYWIWATFRILINVHAWRCTSLPTCRLLPCGHQAPILVWTQHRQLISDLSLEGDLSCLPILQVLFIFGWLVSFFVFSWSVCGTHVSFWMMNYHALPPNTFQWWKCKIYLLSLMYWFIRNSFLESLHGKGSIKPWYIGYIAFLDILSVTDLLILQQNVYVTVQENVHVIHKLNQS